MNAFAEVAAELAEYEAFERFRSNRPDLPAADRRPLRYARALKAEIVNAAVLIAAAASLANAIEAGGPDAPSPKALAVYVPPPATTLAAALERLIGEDVDVEVCHALQSYAARLALAQRMSASFAEQAAGSNLVDPEILADAWRRTCAAARAALSAIEALDRVPAQATELRVTDLLAQAEAGRQPCLDPDGRVTIPGWAERRRETRHDMRADAIARFPNGTVSVVIRDASLSGLGLEMDRRSKPGERVSLTIGSRELTGEIAWADGRRAGLKLDQRLLPGDHLLTRGTNRPAKLKPETPTPAR